MTTIAQSCRVWDDVQGRIVYITVEIEINDDALARLLAARIIRNKTDAAVMHGGIIKAKRVKEPRNGKSDP